MLDGTSHFILTMNVKSFFLKMGLSEMFLLSLKKKLIPRIHSWFAHNTTAWTPTHAPDAISMAFALIHCALTIKPEPCSVAYRPALLLCISSHPIHHPVSVSTSSPLSHQPAIDLLHAHTLTHTHLRHTATELDDGNL